MRPIITAALILVSCVFITTACPTIYTGDSGETCATGYTLGIGHPPGYPLYTLLTKIAMLLPIGDEAFRVNLLAAFLGVMAVLFVFLLAGEFMLFMGAKGKMIHLPALSAALGFAFSGTFWFEGAHAKGGIYMLAVLACAAAFYYLARFYNTDKKKYMYMAVYAAGFLPLIHLTTSLVMLFALGLVFIKVKNGKKVKASFALLLLLIAAFSPVLYLVVRAFSQAVIRWSDVNSLGGVTGLILRKAYYSALDMPFSVEVAVFKFWHHILQYCADYALLIPFVLYGFYAAYKSRRKAFYLCAGFLAVNTAAIVVLTGNSYSAVYLYVNKGFYLVSDMGTMVFAGFGIYSLAYLLKKKIKPELLAGALLAVPLFMLGMNYPASDLSKTFLAYDHAKNIEKSLQIGDTFLCGADTPVFNIAYMKYVKGAFNGINIYDTNANLFDLTPYTGYRGNMTDTRLKIINAELALKGGVRSFTSEFLTFPLYHLRPDPYGIINRFVDSGNMKLGVSNIAQMYTFRDWQNWKYADIACREITARYFISKAQQYGLEGDKQGFENSRYMAEMICPDNPGILSTIASAYFFGQGDVKRSVEYLERAVADDPYFMTAIRLLTRICGLYDKDAAMKWAKIYVQREWDAAKIAEVKKEFGI